MRTSFIKILRWILKYLSRLAIKKYRPKIVGVTGSIGKTSAKLAIKSVLEDSKRVRALSGNLNNDIGFPLTILGDWSGGDLDLVSNDRYKGKRKIRKMIFWIKVIVLSALKILLIRKSKYPEILILEYGADKPGDIKYLLSIAKPHIGVITAIGDIPSHIEFYDSTEDVAREKGRLIDSLSVSDFAVLNYDDKAVLDLKQRTRAKVITFGFGEGADLRIISFENNSYNERPMGIVFKMEHKKNLVPVKLDGVFGEAQCYAAGAAACVGLIFGINLIKISEALEKYRPAPGRMELIDGIKSSLIINDCYNANPNSMRSAIKTLNDLPAKRKIAVLGDMLEIGKYSIGAHRSIGRVVQKTADILITIGPRAKLIADSAVKSGFNNKNLFVFNNVDEAIGKIIGIIKKGDLILVKASHAMRLLELVEAIRKKPDKS